jgi:CheY-like chemotaxis protein
MRRILVVDDDLNVCLAIQGWLNHYGYRVRTADGGAAGLTAIADSSFDLMLIDILMPQMRGFDSIKLFHERAPSVPLIAISGQAFSGAEPYGPDCVRLAIRLGATRCLRKPFRPATLLAVIDECLREKDGRGKYVSTLVAVADAMSEPPDGLGLSSRLLENGVVANFRQRDNHGLRLMPSE